MKFAKQCVLAVASSTFQSRMMCGQRRPHGPVTHGPITQGGRPCRPAENGPGRPAAEHPVPHREEREKKDVPERQERNTEGS